MNLEKPPSQSTSFAAPNPQVKQKSNHKLFIFALAGLFLVLSAIGFLYTTGSSNAYMKGIGIALAATPSSTPIPAVTPAPTGSSTLQLDGYFYAKDGFKLYR